MNRYLLYVSYIGNQFRGVQKIIHHLEPYKPDPTTVQGILEIAIQKLRPVNNICVVPSSRTDTGVHALQSTFHVDLTKYNGELYSTEIITFCLNKYFNSNNINVRIIKTLQVPKTFHCRFNVKSRTYVYRLAILKEKYLMQNSNMNLCYIPIEEYGRCHFLCIENFNWEKVNETSKLLSGYHDFRTFMGRGSHYLHKITRRNLKIKIMNGYSGIICDSSNYGLYNGFEKYDYFNFIFKSKGFLYNQVRRIVGTLIAVGQNKVQPEEVNCMLQIPSYLSWSPRIVPAPSHGLYLWQVEYSSYDLGTFK